MKVLYFHQHFVTPKGVGATRSYAMARKLIELGNQVTMVCGSMSGGTTGLDGEFVKGRRRGFVDGIEVIEFDISYSNKDGFSHRVFKFLKFAFMSVIIALKEDYDLIFATSTPLTAGIPGVFARWLRRKPFVFEVRDLWPELPVAMGVISNPFVIYGMRFLEWISYRSASLLIGLSPGIVQGILAKGVSSDRVIMIPNGCDFDIFTSYVTPWRPAGILPTDLMAVFAGTHGVANGLDVVLDVAQELKNRGRDDIKLLLIGDGKLKPILQERARSESLNCVIFHKPVVKNELAGLMMSTDIGLQILANVPEFYFGTSPNKFFDYISAKLPVLNNYPGWLANMIEAEGCGFVVPPNDPIAFADALEHASENRENLKIMGENGYKLALRTFDRDKLSKEFVTWLELAQNV